MPRRALTLTLAALSAACGPNGPRADLAVTNVTVVDAVDGAREARTVLVTDGRISAVRDATAPVRAYATVDGAGKYLIPGLWDFHIHLTYDDRFTEAMPGLFLYHGITSVRDTGGDLDAVLPVVEAMRAEGSLAPRVFFAGPLLDGEAVVYDGENRPLLGISNSDVETARANVARLAETGVDFVKIYEMVTPEVFDALATEAAARGLPMDGHVPLAMRARDVGPRVQSLEHLRNIEMDCVASAEAQVFERRAILENPEALSGAALRLRMHREYRLPAVAAYDEAECARVFEAMRSTIQVPTLRLNSLSLAPPYARDDWAEAVARLPGEVAGDWGAMRGGAYGDPTYPEFSLFLVGRMHEAGVPVAAGTDTPISYAIPGYSLHSELEFLVRAGLSPFEALLSATVRPAEFFGLEGELGAVREGYLADLVLLSANPLEDIAATRTVEAVITRGRLLDREALDGLVR
jgi:cytosine/adenosine deaminase-related metal-dependent hydrolase